MMNHTFQEHWKLKILMISSLVLLILCHKLLQLQDLPHLLLLLLLVNVYIEPLARQETSSRIFRELLETFSPSRTTSLQFALQQG